MSENEQKSPDIAALHQDLVDQLKTNLSLETERVEAAFRAVPRHPFLPGVPLEQVYSDRAIPTKLQDGEAISSSSQPAIMAIMLEQLDLQPGHRVLEIGAGTGYNAALMAYLVGDEGHVTTIDLDEEIVAEAQTNLAAAGFERVDVVCGDGMAGYAANAPYDRIILTVGGWDIATHWLEQLKEDGRILLPLSINGPQLSVAFDRQNNHLVSASVKPCGFMRIRGESAEPQNEHQLGLDPGLSLEFYTSLGAVDPGEVYQWLTESYQDWSTNVTTTPSQIFCSLLLWLSLNEPRKCSLIAHGDAVEKALVPFLFGDFSDNQWRATVAVMMEDGLGALMRPPDTQIPPPPPEPGEPSPPFAIFVRSFGPNDAAAQRLVALVGAWDKANRPGTEGLRIRAYPVADGFIPGADEKIIKKRWHQFVIDYPDK